jgi:hypothetical protein
MKVKEPNILHTLKLPNSMHFWAACQLEGCGEGNNVLEAAV